MIRHSAECAAVPAPGKYSGRLLLFLACLALVACGESPSETDGQDDVFGTLRARINGELFEVNYAYSNPVAGGRQIVGASSPQGGTGPYIGLTLTPFTGPGTYTLGEATGHLGQGRFRGFLHFDTKFEEGSGTVVITEDRPRLRGTFSFTARGPRTTFPFTEETVTVSEGQFDVPRVN